MSCESWKDSIALEVGGNLAMEEAAALAHHLRECVACRRYADEIAASQQALQRLRQRPLDTASLDRIRAGVLQRIADGKPDRVRWWRRPPKTVQRLALAASVMLVLASLWQLRRFRESAPEARQRDARLLPSALVTPQAPAPPPLIVKEIAPALPSPTVLEKHSPVAAREAQAHKDHSTPRDGGFRRRPALIELSSSDEPLETSPGLVVLSEARPLPSPPGSILMDLTVPAVEKPALRRLSDSNDYTIYWLDDPADTPEETEDADTKIL